MTNVYELDGTSMREREAAHTYLQEMLGFPDWYGKNLDALYDLLTEQTEDTMIFISDADAADEAILETFTDAMEENPALTVIFED
jgi:ribonuclease inhibitor